MKIPFDIRIWSNVKESNFFQDQFQNFEWFSLRDYYRSNCEIYNFFGIGITEWLVCQKSLKSMPGEFHHQETIFFTYIFEIMILKYIQPRNQIWSVLCSTPCVLQNLIGLEQKKHFFFKFEGLWNLLFLNLFIIMKLTISQPFYYQSSKVTMNGPLQCTVHYNGQISDFDSEKTGPILLQF